MHFTFFAFILAVLGIAVNAQHTTSTVSATKTASSSSASTRDQIVTTTITSVTPSASARNASTNVFTLTLTIPMPETNHTLLNGTMANGTTSGNSTVWHEGDDWIPFHIVIDPAYGILGALLIISGVPVAILGGKNRWSSLAICSGYALMLFTLVMILRFGVQPDLQPPSPSPPTTTMRGLFLLAGVIASCIGAGLGVFLYKFARYGISAAGGFTFAWYLLATKSGGLVHGVLDRWCLLGGITVACFIASLPSKLTDIMMLVSTAWIGATTVTLGIDCYSRAGLKEFYIYNLGFGSLFPKLGGAKYPLTQTMQIELGILAAIVLVGAAIQTRVLNILQKRMRKIKEEEEAQIEAEEISRAAERFKNVDAELEEWEEKHGKNSSKSTGESTIALPELEKGDLDDTPLGLLPASHHNSGPSTAWNSVEEFVSAPEEDLQNKLKLLEDVKKARESIRGSLDNLNRASSRISMDATRSRRVSTASTQVLGEPSMPGMTRHGSSASLLDRPRPGSQCAEDEVATSHLMARNRSSGSVLDRPRPGSQMTMDFDPSSIPRIQSSSSLLERSACPKTLAIAEKPIQPRTTASQPSRPVSVAQSIPMTSPSASSTSHQTDWERYKSTRSIQTVGDHRTSISADYGKLSRPPSNIAASKAEFDRMAMPPPSAPLRRSASAQPQGDREMLNTDWAPGQITGSATLPSRPSAMTMPRTMTYEQLSERHRKRISELQNPVTSAMTQEVQAAEARSRWEKHQKAEREEMKRREAEKRESLRDPRRESREALKNTAQWRDSVQSGLDQRGLPVQQQRPDRKRTNSSYSIVN
ncbi:hypothetical protein BD324DRAFT_254203 [Kockovaella imperatae]|uniref:TM7S3/TM198-like domain-containing protein n=1 Tax=Kockovaella imperatae TaxID=4999 RepID=A0A1Y1UPV8_9TREE|nr:hypothetical protein BD324DRAFT_254203 [Kockovaella imperatae]ORX40061.1 hypothetical protein BD324DRAFT_254203 [Kockovaella imperatae]